VNTPQFPEALASKAIELGAPKRYFPVRKIKRVGNLIVFLFLLTSSFLIFIYGFYVASLAYHKHGLAVLDNTLTIPILVSVGLLLLGLAAGWSAYTNWKKDVAVFERGFVVRNRFGVQAWRWEEVVSLTSALHRHYMYAIYTGTTHRYTLVNQLYHRLVLNDLYINVEELAKAIQEGIFPILYESAAREYNAGQMLVFGKVTISKAGIQIGQKTSPWSEVKQVSVQNGILRVSKKESGWFSGARAAVSAIPNLNVLLGIIQQVVGLKVG
jgi:hypothetical protein